MWNWPMVTPTRSPRLTTRPGLENAIHSILLAVAGPAGFQKHKLRGALRWSAIVRRLAGTIMPARTRSGCIRLPVRRG